jgi:RNA polymerase sigma-70 factor (ECF subfamily)
VTLLVRRDRRYGIVRMASQDQVKRALGGERAAIDALVHELSPVVQARVATALFRCGRASRQELEDLTQEILMDLFTGDGHVLASWEPERGLSLTSFVGLVAQRQVYSRLRSRKRSPFTQEPTDPGVLDGSMADNETQPTPEDPVAARELLRLLFAHLHAALSPKALEMFYRLYVWQQEPELIARETGSKLDAVYQWRSRLKKEVAAIEASLLRPGRANPKLELLRSPTQDGSDVSS